MYYGLPFSCWRHCAFYSTDFLVEPLAVPVSGRLADNGACGGHCGFLFVMGTLSYYFTDYLEGFVYFDHWKEYMVGMLSSWDALRIHDQYIITVGVYYVIRYFQGLQKQEQEKANWHCAIKRCRFHYSNHKLTHTFI